MDVSNLWVHRIFNPLFFPLSFVFNYVWCDRSNNKMVQYLESNKPIDSFGTLVRLMKNLTIAEKKKTNAKKWKGKRISGV